MASKITVLIDVVADRATRSVDGFRKSIKDADTTVGKFKAGAGAALDTVKANAAQFAMAAGAALVTFGVKSVEAFQDTALAAGKLRDSLGVTAEEASRLMEVAEDLGIGTETLERSIGIMNRTATNTPQAFAAIGAELVRNADGTTNVNETFLSTIEALNKIPDASARAAAAQKVFGRGWMEMAELIELGADGVRDALASVEEGKIIDDREVERARKFRDSMDALKGAVEELSIEVGGTLVPVITDAADAFGKLKGALDLIPGGAETAKDALDFSAGIPGLSMGIDLVTDSIDKYNNSISESELVVRNSVEQALGLAEATEDVGEQSDTTAKFVDMMADAVVEAGRESADTARDVKKIEDAWRSLKGQLSDRSAILNIADGFDEVKIAGEEAMAANAAGAENAEASLRDYERAQIDLKSAVIDYAEEVGNIPPEKVTAILALIDQGQLAEAERQLAFLTRPRDVYTNIRVIKSGDLGPTQVTPRAGGGVVRPGETTLVGEQGPELVKLPAGSTVYPTGTGPGGGGATYVTINTGADPQQVASALKQFLKTNAKPNWWPR